MHDQAKWGTVLLGYDTLQGHGEQSQPGYAKRMKEHPQEFNKQQYNPGRNQELNLPPDIFPQKKGEKVNEQAFPEYLSPAEINSESMHEKIKRFLGDGMKRKDAIKKAREETRAENKGDIGTISPKDVMTYKYQAEKPGRQMSPFKSQEQGFPFI